jgi:radical SAM protein with 4Fe4S-binding SPASM domain
MQIWRLNSLARLRRTPGGGAVFLPDTVTTVELDAEAFAAISLLRDRPRQARDLRRRLTQHCHRNFTLAETDVLLRDLAVRQVLLPCSEAPPECSPPPLQPVPESVHLQLNNTCNLRCPSCYVSLRREDAGSLPLERILVLIEEWAAMGVFQLALGGGEPLMSPKLAAVVRAARRHGIVPNVTTNGWLVTEELLDQVQGSLGELRLSLNDGLAVKISLVEEKAALLRRRGMRFGFNLIVTRRNLCRLPDLLSWGCAQDAATINLIRPKPAPGNERWYENNALSGRDAARLRGILEELEPLFTRTALAVDCAFSFLFHGQSPRELQERGVAGCAMGERFVTVKWNGDVYPCSHLHGDQFRAGSVTVDSFQEIWQRSEVLASRRRDLFHVDGHCGGCAHNAFCKGCRAVMWRHTGDWLAADTGCALEPIHPG